MFTGRRRAARCARPAWGRARPGQAGASHLPDGFAGSRVGRACARGREWLQAVEGQSYGPAMPLPSQAQPSAQVREEQRALSRRSADLCRWQPRSGAGRGGMPTSCSLTGWGCMRRWRMRGGSWLPCRGS